MNKLFGRVNNKISQWNPLRWWTESNMYFLKYHMLSFYAKDKKKYLSSPKEAFRTAEAAVLGASALF